MIRKASFLWVMLFSLVIFGSQSKMEPLRKDYLLGNYRATRHPGYKKIDAEFSDTAPHYLLKEAAFAFEKMAVAAKKEKISLRIVSGFRSFARQKYIWESKYLGETLVEKKNLLQLFPQNPEKRIPFILKYSAAPGTSRHHWGTDLDINSVEGKYFESDEGKQVYEWLKNNASRFGFFQPYTENRKTGYMPEQWHWSYKPLSLKILQEYRTTVSLKDICGFQGAEFLPAGFYEDYVLGINESLLK